jgi:quinol monooxygenase YgiN
MTVIVIRSRVEPDERHELMQMFKDTSQPNQLPAACLERRLYEEALLPNNLLLIEQWSERLAMHSYLSSDQFRALIGAVKVAGTLVDVRIFESEVYADLMTRLKIEAC